MVMLLLLLGMMLATPPILKFVNDKIAASMNMRKLSSLPAYTINLIVCAVEGLIVVLLPGSWAYACVSWLALWVIATAVIYLGNQIVYNFGVKVFAKGKAAVDSRMT